MPDLKQKFAELCRTDPVLAAGISLIAVRWIVLGIVSYLGPEPWHEAVASHIRHGLFYTGEALLIIAIFQVLWRISGVLRGIVGALAVVVFSLALFLSLSDPILYAIIGDRLSPSVLRQFAGWDLFIDTDFWEPVKTYWLPVSTGVSLLTAYVFWLGWIFFKAVKTPHRPTLRKIAIETACGAAMFFGIQSLNYPLLEPVEMLYGREVLNLDTLTFSAEEEKQRIEALRQFVGLPQGAHWFSDDYPLVYAFNGATPQTGARPDIIVIVVESLRGANFVEAQAGRELASTPHLAALAKNGIFFPRFLANGFPSGPGYISISYGNWPHLRKRIVAEFQHTPMDGIAQRLNSLGYRTVHVEANPAFDKEQSWVAPYTDEISRIGADQVRYDESLANHAMDWINKHDTEKNAAPFFMLYLTRNPHLPYPIPNLELGKFEYAGSLEKNYTQSLSFVDAQLGRLFALLKSRPRSNNTVIIVTGDHANFIDQKRTTAMPVDDTVWTAGIIYGPPRLIGTPRRVTRIGQQADILPTVSALAGDRRPSAALGRNLLFPDNRPQSGFISIRSGGLRYEEDRGGILIDPAFPDAVFAHVTLGETRASNHSLKYSPREIVSICETWTYLLEKNRVWNPALLNGE